MLYSGSTGPMSEAEAKAREVYQQLKEWTKCRENTLASIQDTVKELQSDQVRSLNSL